MGPWFSKFSHSSTKIPEQNDELNTKVKYGEITLDAIFNNLVGILPRWVLLHTFKFI